jgi:hypothetical protein
LRLLNRYLARELLPLLKPISTTPNSSTGHRSFDPLVSSRDDPFAHGSVGVMIRFAPAAPVGVMTRSSRVMNR